MATEKDVVEWLLKPLDASDREEFSSARLQSGKHANPLHKSFDCSIMDIADDITFGVHDLEDVIGLELIDQAQFRESVQGRVCKNFLENFGDLDYDGFVCMLFGNGGERKRAVGRLVGYFVRSCKIRTIESLQNPIVRYRAQMIQEATTLLDALTELVRDRVIFSAEVQHLEFKGQQLVISVFEALGSVRISRLVRSSS